MATVEIVGLDIYDPIKNEVKSRDVHDIAYWMVNYNYDGSNFVVRQVLFCGDKNEFDENYSFQVAGTNQTLNQKVVFSGNLEIISNETTGAHQTCSGVHGSVANVLQGPPGQRQPQRLNSRVVGTAMIDHSNRIEINALPVIP